MTRGGALGRRRGWGACRNDGGIIMVWIATMLTMLMAFAGFAVDAGNWYHTAGRMQRAADAGALAGAVFMPGDPTNAKAIAKDVVTGNGFSLAQGDTVTVGQGDRPSQLKVTITHSVRNYFTPLLGLPTTTITRSAVAEFQGKIPMGSPDNRLASDPETGFDPHYWVNVAGPNSTKVSGDRFGAKVCDSAVYSCSASSTPNNTEYSTDGYTFTVAVGSNFPANQPLRIQVYDPLFAYVGDTCGDVTFPTTTELTALAGMDGTANIPSGYYDDASSRYAGGNTAWCTGDQRINNLSNTATTFIVRSPDDTAYSELDNPVVNTSTCQPMRTRAFDPTGTNPTLAQLLHPTDGIADSEAVVNSSDNFSASGLSFVEGFRRWVTVCEIPGSEVERGEYVVQVRTNAASGAPLVYDSSISTGGHNRMAIRAGSGSSGVPVGTGTKLFGAGSLPVYANDSASSSEFYLARVLPSGGPRVLSILLFDMGDAASAGTLTLLGPDGNPYSPSGGCLFLRTGWGTTVSSSNCTLTNVSSSNGYNGRIVEIQAPIPTSYSCDPSVPTNCWFKIRASFPGGVNDTTTWQAQMVGDPVRLVE